MYVQRVSCSMSRYWGGVGCTRGCRTWGIWLLHNPALNVSSLGGQFVWKQFTLYWRSVCYSSIPSGGNHVYVSPYTLTVINYNSATFIVGLSPVCPCVVQLLYTSSECCWHNCTLQTGRNPDCWVSCRLSYAVPLTGEPMPGICPEFPCPTESQTSLFLLTWLLAQTSRAIPE